MSQTKPQFDALVAEHGPAIGRVAAAFERDTGLREDLTQDILLAIWQALPKFRGDAPLQHFVLRIAHNRAASHALKASRAPRSAELDARMPAETPTVEAQAMHSESAQRLLAAVQQLPVDDRQLVTLALEGLPYKDIADLLDLTVNHVGVKLNRARKRLKTMMEGRQ